MNGGKALRGADIVAQTLARYDFRRVFTLSGNHIMSLFDAAIEAELELVHVRHEAAAVHMADAWGRLTDRPGIAMVTGGPGHANAVGALYTAHAAESPMVLLSGHAATWELGRGGFQEIRQADMAAPVTKASWTATSAANLGHDIGEALTIAMGGRPGPVHLSLPSDLLEERVEASAIRWPEKIGGRRAPELEKPVAQQIIEAIRTAKHPVILAGPTFSVGLWRVVLADLERATHAPAVVLESPRGFADATLGGFQDLVRRSDLIVLLGKALDFTTRWLTGSSFDSSPRVIAIDPDPAMIERAARELGPRLLIGTVADPRTAAMHLIANVLLARSDGWRTWARRTLDERPADWATVTAKMPGRLHPAEVFRVLRPYVERDPKTVLICDGGEFAQWGQSMLPVTRRVINGVAGSIGASLSFANAARLAEPNAPVFAVLGDGTIGFHISEFETAVRRNLPFVAILGNDALWNAESQIQLREYGSNRMHGCDLTPARYDLVVAALGGHGEYVERAADLAPAIERALASRKPACINIMIESIAAPAIRLS